MAENGDRMDFAIENHAEFYDLNIIRFSNTIIWPEWYEQKAEEIALKWAPREGSLRTETEREQENLRSIINKFRGGRNPKRDLTLLGILLRKLSIPKNIWYLESTEQFKEKLLGHYSKKGLRYHLERTEELELASQISLLRSLSNINPNRFLLENGTVEEHFGATRSFGMGPDTDIPTFHHEELVRIKLTIPKQYNGSMFVIHTDGKETLVVLPSPMAPDNYFKTGVHILPQKPLEKLGTHAFLTDGSNNSSQELFAIWLPDSQSKLAEKISEIVKSGNKNKDKWAELDNRQIADIAFRLGNEAAASGIEVWHQPFYVRQPSGARIR